MNWIYTNTPLDNDQLARARSGATLHDAVTELTTR
jgi:hypothetical protein